MLQGRTIQIKMVKDTADRLWPDTPAPKNPENTPEAKTIEVITQATGCVVVGYTICRSVDFFFKMAEHVIVNR